MGRYKTHAKDGTPRCSDPQQDAAGNWYCPACGRASGFKSRMAVLGHLRNCRPGKPALDDLLGPAAALPVSSSVYLPSPNEAAQINGMGAILSRLDQMASVQAQHSRALGNHITHLSAQSAASAPSSFSMTDVVKWGGMAVMGLYAVSQLTTKPPTPPSWLSWYKPSDSTVRIQQKVDESKAARCAAIWKAKAEGQSVEIDADCLAPEPPSKTSPARSGAGSLKQLAGFVKDAAAMASAIKKLA